MNEHPILFSRPMVQAILEGRKTMTRRVVKGIALDWLTSGFTPEFVANFENHLCPYGDPGDRLWVRETFADRDRNGNLIVPIYRADGKEVEDGDGVSFTPRWRPSIHMSRKYSRLILEVVFKRIERLQDISEEDAKAEGGGGDRYIGQGFDYCVHREAFRTLWESINGPGAWDANPWVWVVEFKRIDG